MICLQIYKNARYGAKSHIYYGHLAAYCVKKSGTTIFIVLIYINLSLTKLVRIESEFSTTEHTKHTEFAIPKGFFWTLTDFCRFKPIMVKAQNGRHNTGRGVTPV